MYKKAEKILKHLDDMGIKTDKEKKRWLDNAMKFLSVWERVGPVKDNCWKKRTDA